ncbi:membrane protein [Frondihabitans sucicola]|uniref:Membrane protein n=1 Tax=Frondihabitans sucicola TaxID=1268041 RepID=A0ABN6Y137_9MICO|nr:membrane protein [Frondihabitans sucicola]
MTPSLSQVPPSTREHRPKSRVTLSKVPEVTALFWVVKLLTTGAGETSSDFLVSRLNPIVGVGIGFVLFAVAMTLQYRVTRYVPVVYWFAVVMVSVFGTMCADVLHVGLGVPYLMSAPAFAVILAVVFALWRRSEGTLSIHSITTRRRETFYWLSVLATFALGTATGDLTATTFHLGYLASGLVFVVVILVPAVGHAAKLFGPVLAFWFAYVVTRPIGASFADWMGVSHARSGLGWGTGPVSLVLLVVIAALVGVLSIRSRGGAGSRVPRRG